MLNSNVSNQSCSLLSNVGGGGEIVKLNPELGEKLSPVTDPEIYNLM